MSKNSNHDGRRPRAPSRTPKPRSASASRGSSRSFAGKDRNEERPQRGARPPSRSAYKGKSETKHEGRSFRRDGERPARQPRTDAPRDFEPWAKNADGDTSRARFSKGKPAQGRFAEGKSFRERPERSERPERRERHERPNARPPRFEHKEARPKIERTSTMEGERIAKVMSRVGLCSRRDAESWIEQGRVEVNGEVLTSPALNVLPADRILVDGQPLAQRERTRLFLFNKPRGLVTTDHDPEGRPTIFSALPKWMPRVITIGRLDINTEGLLLLTNDGGLARVLELPATGWLRRYRVRANGTIDQAQLDHLRHGVTIDGIDYAGIEAKLDRVQGANVWLTMGLREGKNREIKRVLEHLGLAVNRLIRLSFGPFQLGELAEGDVEEIKTRILRDQLGEALADEAGCDFQGPIFSSPETMSLIDAPLARHKDGARNASSRGPKSRGDMSRGSMSRRPSHDRRGAEVEETAPRKDRPPPRTRKHISALRADKKDERGPRRPIERTQTEDRKGRSIAVERVSSTRSPARNGKSRNEKRFAQERGREERGYKERGYKERGRDAPRGDKPQGRSRPAQKGGRIKRDGPNPRRRD